MVHAARSKRRYHPPVCETSYQWTPSPLRRSELYPIASFSYRQVALARFRSASRVKWTWSVSSPPGPVLI